RFERRKTTRLEQACAAAIRLAFGDEPGLIGRIYARAGAGACRTRQGRAGSVVRRESERPSLGMAIVDLAVDFGDDLDWNLRTGLQIQLVNRRRRRIVVIRVVYELQEDVVRVARVVHLGRRGLTCGHLIAAVEEA